MSLTFLFSTIQSRYDIGHITKSRPLAGGEWKTLYRIDTARGPFVVSVAHPSATAGSVAWEHAFLYHIAPQLPIVPVPIPARDGSTFFVHDGRIISLLPFMPGEIVDGDDIRLPAAQLLAQFHRAAQAYPDQPPRPGIPPLRQWNWHSNHAWHWPDVDALMHSTPETAPRIWRNGGEYTREIVARRAQIAEERLAVACWVEQLAAPQRPLTFGIIHDDFYDRNILMDAGRVTALLDWDGCHPDWLMMDVSNAVWEFCQNRPAHTLDIKAAHTFIDTYLAAGGPVSRDELDVLVPFIRFRRVLESLSGLQNVVNGEQWDEGFSEYTLHTLVSLENLKDVTLNV